VSTQSVTVGSIGQCMLGTGPEVHIYGGSPPYTLSNSLPQGMKLDKTVVQHSGESFVITFTNSICMTNMPITIEDRMGRVTQVMVSNGA